MKRAIFFYLLLFVSFGIYAMEVQENCLVVRMGGYSIQGQRNYQEDRFGFDEIQHAGKKFFCSLVADGHAGDGVAQLVKDKFFGFFQQGLNSEKTVGQSLRFACAQCEELTKTESLQGMGSTLLAACSDEQKLHVLWLGDSQALFGGSDYYITPAHTPTNEKERIEQAGGKIVNGKINGMIGVSRALGDAFAKSKGMPIDDKPDCCMYEFKNNFGYFIGASDGFWNVVKTGEAMSLIYDAKTLSEQKFYDNYAFGRVLNETEDEQKTVAGQHENQDAFEVARRLARYAVMYGSCDNVTVVVMLFGDDNWQASSSSSGSSSDSSDSVDSGSGFSEDGSSFDETEDKKEDEVAKAAINSLNNLDSTGIKDQKKEVTDKWKSFIRNHKYFIGGSVAALLAIVVAAYHYNYFSWSSVAV